MVAHGSQSAKRGGASGREALIRLVNLSTRGRAPSGGYSGSVAQVPGIVRVTVVPRTRASRLGSVRRSRSKLGTRSCVIETPKMQALTAPVKSETAISSATNPPTCRRARQ